MSTTTALAALTATAWAHAAFQLTVTSLVYPVLAATPTGAWRRAHDRHSRVVSPLVVPLYAAVLVSTAAALLAVGSAAVWVAAAARTRPATTPTPTCRSTSSSARSSPGSGAWL